MFPTSIKDVSKHHEKQHLFVNKNEPKRRWHNKLRITLPETLPDATFLVTSAPGASKIIQIVIPQMSVVGFGATKMAPQGTTSLFRGLCEPFLYAKFRNFDAFKRFSGFPTLILKHFGTQNRSSDDIFSCFV